MESRPQTSPSCGTSNTTALTALLGMPQLPWCACSTDLTASMLSAASVLCLLPVLLQ